MLIQWLGIGFAVIAASCALPRLFGALWRFFRGEGAFFVRGKWQTKPSGDADTLLVAAHGWVPNLSQFDRAVRVVADSLAAAGGRVDTMLVRYPGNFFSDEDPSELASELRVLIGRAWAEKPYRRLVFFSHSFGTLLLRQAYLEDRGDPNQRSMGNAAWWGRLDRFVQATGVNGGFDRDYRLLLRLGVWVGQWIGRGKLIRASERGKPFIENIRAQWVEACQEARRSPETSPIPMVIQLHVSNDELLDESNNVDIASTPKFFMLHVPGANHASVIDVGWRFLRGRDPWRTRVEALKLATVGDETALANAAQEMTHAPSADEAAVTDIVIVAHGIRDRGRWASLFASEIEATNAGRFAVVTDRFDRTSAFTLLFGNRDKQVRWFADSYVRARAKYPNAERVHFIGHSYGTYVMAAALTQYSSLRFDRVYLAGSVLPRDFDWSDKINAKQVNTVMNVCASADWIVGCFPGFYDWVRRNVPLLRHWKRLYLGDAGFAGFDQLNRRELSFLPGGHGAFADIAPARQAACAFIARGEMLEPTKATFTVGKPNGLVEAANTWVPVVWFVGGVALVAASLYLAPWIPIGDPNAIQLAGWWLNIDFAYWPELLARLLVTSSIVGFIFRIILSLM